MTVDDIDQLPSRPFKGFDWSDHVNVIRLIDVIFAEYTAWYKGEDTGKRIRDPDQIKRHLTHFVLEAYRTYRAMPTLLIGVPLGNRYYNEESTGRYHPKHLSYRVVRNVTEFLESADYLELPFGKSGWHPDESLRRTTRYRATQRLIRLCDEYGVNRFMIVPYMDPEVIILRKKKKRGQSSGDLAEYTDTPFTRRARENLQNINQFIAGHLINLDISDDQEEELLLRLRRRDDRARDSFIDFTKTRLKRIFNNSSFEEGGRFYGGWWQQIPGDYRVLITIDGKRTVQLDYSGMHFAIMYAKIGMDIPMDDPYALKGYGVHLRGDIKIAFNIIINCRSREEAIGTLDNRIKDGELSGELVGGDRLIEAFIDTHPLIQDKIASGEGIKGQYTDSRVAERVLLKGIDIGLCILPIHDGFITTKGDEFVLERLMNDAFLEVTGYKAVIKPETFDLSVLHNAGNNKPHWITRSDGTVERDGPLEGKAKTYSEVISGPALWEAMENDTGKKKNKALRDKEWWVVHGQ